MRAGVYGRESRGNVKSIDDQMGEGRELCGEQGWEVRAYSDKVSASWFGTKRRGGWDEVLADLASGELDVLVLWESSRGDRRLTEWSRLLDTCEERGVLIHVISHERTYDLRKPRDWETLAEDGVKSQAEVLRLSGRVQRGVRLAARAGRPAAGPCPYGYRRLYDPTTGALLGQEPDPATAPVVAEIIDRVAKSESLSKIADDLNARGVTPPGAASANGQKSAMWYRERVRKIATSRTYLGERKHKGEWHPADWPALTNPETFAAAARVLSDPRRLTSKPETRPGHQKHLLTYFATCSSGHSVGARGAVYNCSPGCFQVKREPVDALIRDLVVGRLSDPEIYNALMHANETANEVASAARAEVAALSGDLAEYRAAARARKLSPASFIELEAGLLADIEAANARAEAATIPAELKGWTGPAEDVRARWNAAPVAARRTVMKALRLKVTLRPAGQSAYAELTDRVQVDWL